jgi:hypothetical protein
MLLCLCVLVHTNRYESNALSRTSSFSMWLNLCATMHTETILHSALQVQLRPLYLFLTSLGRTLLFPSPLSYSRTTPRGNTSNSNSLLSSFFLASRAPMHVAVSRTQHFPDIGWRAWAHNLLEEDVAVGCGRGYYYSSNTHPNCTPLTKSIPENQVSVVEW